MPSRRVPRRGEHVGEPGADLRGHDVEGAGDLRDARLARGLVRVVRALPVPAIDRRGQVRCRIASFPDERRSTRVSRGGDAAIGADLVDRDIVPERVLPGLNLDVRGPDRPEAAHTAARHVRVGPLAVGGQRVSVLERQVVKARRESARRAVDGEGRSGVHEEHVGRHPCPLCLGPEATEPVERVAPLRLRAELHVHAVRIARVRAVTCREEPVVRQEDARAPADRRRELHQPLVVDLGVGDRRPGDDRLLVRGRPLPVGGGAAREEEERKRCERANAEATERCEKGIHRQTLTQLTLLKTKHCDQE